MARFSEMHYAITTALNHSCGVPSSKLLAIISRHQHNNDWICLNLHEGIHTWSLYEQDRPLGTNRMYSIRSTPTLSGCCNWTGFLQSCYCILQGTLLGGVSTSLDDRILKVTGMSTVHPPPRPSTGLKYGESSGWIPTLVCPYVPLYPTDLSWTVTSFHGGQRVQKVVLLSVHSLGRMFLYATASNVCS